MTHFFHFRSIIFPFEIFLSYILHIQCMMDGWMDGWISFAINHKNVSIYTQVS